LTMRLAVGEIGGLSDLKATWLKYNHDNGNAVQVCWNVKEAKGNKARYFSICVGAPKKQWSANSDCCKAHLRAVGTDQDNMEIVSMQLVHTCSGAT
jgi:hypothetical protein